MHCVIRSGKHGMCGSEEPGLDAWSIRGRATPFGFRKSGEALVLSLASGFYKALVPGLAE